MFGQNQDDQQVVVPPPQDLTNATSAPSNDVVIPEPDESNTSIIKPDTASSAESEPEPQVQSAPMVPQNQNDDLAIPDDIQEEDIAPATTPQPKVPPEIPQVTVDKEGFLANLPGLTDATDDLSELKHKALEALSPLVDELDQEPEEKFSTTMMLIQASDNKDLLPKAYEAAQAITDDKAKAQALLDVVNEINYFSQPKN